MFSLQYESFFREKRCLQKKGNALEWRIKYCQSSTFVKRENSLLVEEPSDINRTERFLIYYILYKNHFETISTQMRQLRI